MKIILAASLALDQSAHIKNHFLCNGAAMPTISPLKD